MSIGNSFHLVVLGAASEECGVWMLTESSMERDHFMSPEEAKLFGLVDEVIERRPESLVADSLVLRR